MKTQVWSVGCLMLLLIHSCAPDFWKGRSKPVAPDPAGIARLDSSTCNILLEGFYNGKNTYIQNPFAGSGMGFCTKKILVNNKEINCEINSTAFEIDLKSLNLKLRDSLKIEILHKCSCKPKVLAPMHPDRGTFSLATLKALSDGTIMWTSKNEEGKFIFMVQQYRWNKWITVGEVPGMGTPGEHSYEFKIVPHSGQNQVRIKQMFADNPHISRPVTFTSDIQPVTIVEINKPKIEITLSAESSYEMYDREGNMVMKGSGKNIDCSGLPPEVYFLNYDNTTTEIDLQKPKKNKR